MLHHCQGKVLDRSGKGDKSWVITASKFGTTHRIDPHRASIELSSDATRFFQVIRPHTGPKAHVGVVGTSDDIRLVGPGHKRDNGAKRLLSGDSGVIRRLVDDRRCDEIARLVLYKGIPLA